MSFTDETVRFEFDDSSKKEIGETLVSVYKSLGEKGYNPNARQSFSCYNK